MFRFVILIAATAVFLLLAGCGGEQRHGVYTGEDGSLEGLVITPEPQSLGIDTGEVFLLDWRTGYDPPAEFTLSLRQVYPDGTTEPIYTELEEIDVGHYRLEPTWYLPTETFVLLTITGDGARTRAMYLTERSSIYDTKARRNDCGQAEHTVTRK